MYCLYKPVHEAYKDQTGHYIKIDERGDLPCGQLVYLIRYIDVPTEWQQIATHSRVLWIRECTFGNRATDNICLSPPAQPASGTAPQDGHRALLRVCCRTLDWLGPLSAVSTVRIQRAGTLLDRHDTIMHANTSSATCPGHSKSGKSDTRGHNGTAHRCQTSSIYFCASWTTMQPNARNIRDFLGLLEAHVRQNRSMHFKIPSQTTFLR